MCNIKLQDFITILFLKKDIFQDFPENPLRLDNTLMVNKNMKIIFEKFILSVRISKHYLSFEKSLRDDLALKTKIFMYES